VTQTLGELMRYYLGPTGIPQRMGAANEMLNPVEGIGRSMQASQQAFAPGKSPMQRVQSFGEMASEIAGVAAPVGAAAKMGGNASKAIAEALTGAGQSASNAAEPLRQFAGDESGALKLYQGSPQDFEYLGYRTVDAGHDPVASSRIWVDGDPTDDFLPGVSVTDVNAKTAKKMHKLEEGDSPHGYYLGDEVYLIGGNIADRGEDYGELVIRDPVIVDLIRKYGIAGAAAMLGMSQADVAQAMQGGQAQPQTLGNIISPNLQQSPQRTLRQYLEQ